MTSRPARKPGKSRLRRSSPLASEDEETTEVEDATLAALSGSRSSSRHKPSDARSQRSAGSFIALIVVDSPGKPVAAAASSLNSPGEVSSDSEGVIIITNSPSASVNKLLTQSDYRDLTRVKSNQAEWIPGYRDRSTRSSAQVTHWSARRIIRVSVAELNVDFFFRHFVKPKRYPFPTLKVSNNPPVPADWAPGLVSMVQIETLYASEPWESAFPQVAPIFFRRVG